MFLRRQARGGAIMRGVPKKSSFLGVGSFAALVVCDVRAYSELCRTRRQVQLPASSYSGAVRVASAASHGTAGVGDLRTIQEFEAESGFPTKLNPAKVLHRSKQQTHKRLGFVKNNGGVWPLSSEGNSRMIRFDEYPELWARMKTVIRRKRSGSKGLVILGHPGIGKSYLLDVLLSLILFSEPRLPVIVLNPKGAAVFVKTGKREFRYNVRCGDALVSSVEKILATLGVKKHSSLLLLHDIKSEKSLPYNTNLVESLRSKYYSLTTVVASSPLDSNCKDFNKDFPGREEYYMPLLSQDEAVEFVEDQGVSRSEALERFNKVGGVLRHLLDEEHVANVVQSIEEECASGSVPFDPRVDSRITNPSSRLLCPVPDRERRGRTFDFVSRHAARLWTESTTSYCAVSLDQLRAAEHSVSRAGYGCLFEQWALAQVQQGGLTLFYSPLGTLTKPKHRPGALEPWVIPEKLAVMRFPGDTKAFDDVEPHRGPTLHIPSNERYPVVDAILTMGKRGATLRTETILMQMTVGATHKPKEAKTAQLLKGLRDEGCDVKAMVWVVDSNSPLETVQALTPQNPSARAATKKKVRAAHRNAFGNIPQYLCRMDAASATRWVRREGDNKDPVHFPCPTEESEVLSTIRKYVDRNAKSLVDYAAGLSGTKEKPIVFRTASSKKNQ